MNTASDEDLQTLDKDQLIALVQSSRIQNERYLIEIERLKDVLRRQALATIDYVPYPETEYDR